MAMKHAYITANAERRVCAVPTVWTGLLSRYCVDISPLGSYCVDMCLHISYHVDRFLAISIIYYNFMYDLIYLPLSQLNNLSRIIIVSWDYVTFGSCITFSFTLGRRKRFIICIGDRLHEKNICN